MRAIDPIDRITLMEKLGIGKECTVCEQNSDPYCMWKPDVVDVCEAICTVPTIEPRCETCETFNKTRLLIPQPERKKGKWIPQNLNKSDGMISTAVYYYPKCSVCGASANYTNFCPNCGAEMTEESEEPKRCDTCKHEKSRWFSRCADCSDYELWESKE